jgi:hypothetical protein
MSHTPGPWKLVKANPGQHWNLITRDVEFTYPNTGRKATAGQGIALMQYNSTTVLADEQYQANARLIAQAPAMLDFAQQVAETPASYWIDDRKELQAKARAILRAVEEEPVTR